MSAQSSIFPAFITDTYQPGSGFAEFERAAGNAAQNAVNRQRQVFEAGFAEIQQIATRALNAPRNVAGSLDINVGQYRQAAQAAEANAIALREVAAAAERVAREERDLSEATRIRLQAYRAAAVEAEGAAQRERNFADAMELVQEQLNRTSSGTQHLIDANGRLVRSNQLVAVSSGASRMGMIGVGQQLQDLTVGLASGQRATIVFAQQLPQLAFALTSFGGAAGRVGTFLAGPWGAALFAGATVLSLFASRTEEATEAQDSLAQAGNAVSSAQSILGRMFDLTTGKLTTQNEVVREAIRLQAILGQIEAQRKATAAMGRLQGMEPSGTIDANGQPTSFSQYLEAGGLDGGMGNLGNAPRDNPGVAAYRRLLENYSRTRNASVTEFRHALERLQASGGLAGADINAAVGEAITIADQRQQYQAMGDARRIAEGAPLPSYLRQRPSGGGGRDRQDNRPEEASRALETVQRINETWNAQPALVDRAAQATRELDRILAEASRRNLPRTDELVAGAEQAKDSIREGLIRQIVEPFAEAPRLVQRASEAMDQLAAAAANPAFGIPADKIREAAQAIQNGLLRPYRDLLQTMVQSYDVQVLAGQGRDEEADALRAIQGLEERIGDIGEARRQTILAGVAALAQQNRELEIQRQAQERNLAAAGAFRTAYEGLFENGRVDQFAGGLFRSFKTLNAQALTERIFGPALREFEDFATGRQRVRMSNEQAAASVDTMRTTIQALTTKTRDQATAVGQVTDKLKALNEAAGTAATALTALSGGRTASGPPAGASAAETANWNAWNRPGAGIPSGNPLDPNLGASGLSIADALHDLNTNLASLGTNIADYFDQNVEVTGRRRAAANDNTVAPGMAHLPDPLALFTRGMTDTLTRVFGDRQLAGRLAGVLGKAMQGAAYGDTFEGLTRSIGIQLPPGLARAGGALLNQIPGFSQVAGPIGIGLAANLGIGQLLGNDQLKHGQLLSLLVGPFFARMFGSALRGSSTITGASGAIATTGNSRKYREASATAAGSVQEMLQRIADAFGATLHDGIGAVSIGVRKGNYRVDPTGSGKTKLSAGAIDFGKDAEAAMRAAVLDLIKDGVLEGLRLGSQRLLQSTKDLEAGIDKALKFEGVFTALKERLDPVGAALDAVNKKFDGLRKIFAEAGASAEELAQLEQLYGFERADAIKEATEKMTGALRGLLDDLTVNNDARSLRERLAFAHATYDPLAARVASGDRTVDYDAFAEAARTILDIQRQISGSTNPYFDLLNQITDLTRKALAGQENIISLATAQTGTGQGSTSAASAAAPVVSAIDQLSATLVSELGGQLDAVNDNLGTLIGMTRLNQVAVGTGGDIARYGF